jgi:hypothetical protein
MAGQLAQIGAAKVKPKKVRRIARMSIASIRARPRAAFAHQLQETTSPKIRPWG